MGQSTVINTKLLANSRLLVNAGGSQKSYEDFRLYRVGGSAPLTPELFKGQLRMFCQTNYCFTLSTSAHAIRSHWNERPFTLYTWGTPLLLNSAQASLLLQNLTAAPLVGSNHFLFRSLSLQLRV